MSRSYGTANLPPSSTAWPGPAAGGPGSSGLPAAPTPSPTGAAGGGEAAGASWPWPQPGAFMGSESRTDEADRDPAGAAGPRDRKALENILAELRKEVDRLDEDAWMFKKLPF
mmetsp:Transcript_44835/g.83768  ORF Transcript_44835/g.83768 Transcript_44835/m.83768 type:complete len:113 (-) Transcript_44835:100-438(-)